MPTARHENELWIYLAVSWWIGSFVAWIGALFWSQLALQSDSSWLTVAGLIVFGVSAILRLPTLTNDPQTSNAADHFVWLLSLTASINWLGYLFLHCRESASCLPAAMICVCLEWLLISTAIRQGSLTTLSSQLITLQRRWWPSRQTTTVWPVDSAPKSATTNSPSGTPAVADKENTASSTDRILRSCQDGIDEDGNRYVAGESCLTWTADQSMQVVVVGFVPAFEGQPAVEIEVDEDLYQAVVLNCTSTGMRIQIRRLNRRDDDSSTLAWCACQRLEHPQSTSTTQSLA